jgi:hypothetical protein
MYVIIKTISSVRIYLGVKALNVTNHSVVVDALLNASDVTEALMQMFLRVARARFSVRSLRTSLKLFRKSAVAFNGFQYSSKP